MTTTENPSVFDAALPTVAYHGVQRPETAHRIIAEARSRSSIAMGPFGPELLSYDLVRLALRDSRFGMPHANGLAMQGITSGPLWDKVSELIVGIDGPRHRRLRRLVSQAFTPRAAERLRSACRSIISELVDQCVDSRCDVVTDIAGPYPIPIICALLGVPREDWNLFSDWLKGLGKAFGPTAPANSATILEAWRNMDEYLDGLIAERRRVSTDDLLCGLLRAEGDGDRLSRREIRDLVAVLLVAGTDTTRNQLAAAMETMVAHPNQWRLITQEPACAPAAVEEIMRHSPASYSAIRIAREDVTLGGVVIPAETCVVVNTASANRDPARFDRPDRLDVQRADPQAMLTFGGGAHHCLGAHLARVELAEALAVLARRMPRIRCVGPVTWRPIFGIAGPKALPIDFAISARKRSRSVGLRAEITGSASPPRRVG
jgi:cytochrome P450